MKNIIRTKYFILCLLFTSGISYAGVVREAKTTSFVDIKRLALEYPEYDDLYFSKRTLSNEKNFFITGVDDSGTVFNFNVFTDEKGEHFEYKGLRVNDNPNEYIPIALSRDYSTLSGVSTLPDGINYPIIWYGKDFKQSKIIGSPNMFANTLSGDGHVAGGTILHPEIAIDYTEALIWRGSSWEDLVYPAKGSYKGVTLSPKAVLSLTDDGKIAAGFSTTSLNQPVLSVWTGRDFEQVTYPEKDEKQAFVIGDAVLSGDGNVVAGVYQNRNNNKSNSVLYYDEKWHNKTPLRSLAGARDDDVAVHSLSRDGSVAGGYSEDQRGLKSATLWSGPGWSVLTDLGQHSPDSTLQSQVSFISDDATVASGTIFDKEDRLVRLVLWKIFTDQPENAGPSASQPPFSPDTAALQSVRPLSENKVVRIDVQNTQRAVDKLSSDALGVIQLQYESLKRLGRYCTPDAGKTCWSALTGFRGGEDAREFNTGFSMGTSLTEYLDAGFSVDQSFSRSLPGSFRHAGDNSGAGFFLKFRHMTDDGEWFVTPALAFNRFTSDIKRQKLMDTEAGEGSTDIRGLSYSLTAGKNFTLDDDTTLGWYTGIRRDVVTMDGWKEDSRAFPLTWDKTAYKRTDLTLGLHSEIPVYDNLKLVSTSEISHRIAGGGLHVTSHNEWLGNFDRNIDTAKNNWMVSAGLDYAFNQNIQISAIPSVQNTTQDRFAYGISVGVHGQF